MLAPYPASSSSTNTSTAHPLTAKAGVTLAYTDGACKGNPGAGGWGAHLIYSDGSTQDLYGGESNTTNNRMELMGAIQALRHSPIEMTLEIWTDSSYVKNGITDWIEGWKKRGWKTASKKAVANQDLWQQLDELRQKREVEWHWVKGHAGHAGNEKADELANLGVTSSSEQDTNNAIKKKDPLVTTHSANDFGNSNITNSKASTNNHADDWLNDDPLGLDTFYDEFENAELEQDMVIDNERGQLNVDNAQGDNPIQTTSQSHSIPMPQAAAMADTIMPKSETKNTTMTIDSTKAADLPKFDGDTSRANPNFQPLLPKPIHRHHNNRQLIMDTETTGLDALKGDRVIEVGIVEMIGRKFTGEKLHVYINPQRGMDEEVIRIHGISDAFLTDKPTFDQVAQALYEFMDGAEIIAHNASFDMNFLNMEFDKVGMSDFAQRVQVTDSLLMAKQQYPGQKNTLDALVRRLNVGKQDRTFHGALLDSEILAEVYLAMTGGQVSLGIEEDSNNDGIPTAHNDFSELAALLLSSKSDPASNLDWYTQLSEQYPEIKNNLP